MNGTELITAERKRQIDSEGWTPDYDEAHFGCELVDAAICYANKSRKQVLCNNNSTFVPDIWPWDACWWKPSDDPIRNLIKAGALIAAEIDRLQRKGGNNG